VSDFLSELWLVIKKRIEEKPQGSYTAEIVKRGLPFAARKFGEESVELIVASLSEPRDSVIYEAADVIYHLMVLLALRGVDWAEVIKELERRSRAKSGAGGNS